MSRKNLTMVEFYDDEPRGPSAWDRRARYPQFPHAKHAITTLCTCGLWLPFWLLFYFIFKMMGGR